MTDVPPSDQDPEAENGFRVLIAGGGVAAVEALLALRVLAGDRVKPVLFAPDPAFRYRPLSVTEPFDLAAPRNLDLLDIALDHDAKFLCDGLAEVDPERRQVKTTGGQELGYDALLIGIGARGVEAVPGALTFKDSADGNSYRRVLEEFERRTTGHLVFAAPGGVAWPLGLYELALLSSAHLRERGIDDVQLTLVTPEAQPMGVFGSRASAAVGEMLDQAGISLRLNSRPIRFDAGQLAIDGGETIAGDRVISLPSPEVAPISGIPQQHGGFIAVDRFCGVLGVDRVFAAGDVTTFPVKQGGVAAQMADCAAGAIAALAGSRVEPEPFRPVLRGALLTQTGPRYLRSQRSGGSSTASKATLWWPPAKVAGKYLAPFLAEKAGYHAHAGSLEDLEPPVGDDVSSADDSHEDVVAVALSYADAKSRERDFPGALRWLEVAEDLELYLPREYELKRTSWQELARPK